MIMFNSLIGNSDLLSGKSGLNGAQVLSRSDDNGDISSGIREKVEPIMEKIRRIRTLLIIIPLPLHRNYNN